MRKSPIGYRDKLPTQEELWNAFNYDETTGSLIRIRSIKKYLIGIPSGSLDARGYLRVCILGRQYYVHRLVWCYLYGTWPKVIEHVNGIKYDNRRENLRECTKAENLQNKTTLYKNNKSGFTGVFWYAGKAKWTAYITLNRKTINLGYFESKEMAIKARKKAKLAHHIFC